MKLCTFILLLSSISFAAEPSSQSKKRNVSSSNEDCGVIRQLTLSPENNQIIWTTGDHLQVDIKGSQDVSILTTAIAGGLVVCFKPGSQGWTYFSLKKQ